MQHKSKRLKHWPALCGAVLAMALLLGQGALTVGATEAQEEQELWNEPMEEFEEPFEEPYEPTQQEEEPEAVTGEEATLPELIAEDDTPALTDEPAENTKEPERSPWEVASEQELLAVLPLVEDGGTILLLGSFTLTHTIVLPAGVSVNLLADEYGPYTIYTAGGMRHFLLEGAADTAISFENITLSSEDSLSGGVEFAGSSNVAIKGAHITGTAADLGGAVQLRDSAVLLEGCVFEDNAARLGGAIYLDEASGLRLENTLLAGNSAENGGAVALEAYETLSADAATRFYSNRAAEGYELADENLIALHGNLIEATAFTGIHQYAYNNHDINYAPEVSGKAVPGSFGGESRRQQREEEAHAQLGDGYGYWQGSAALPGAGNGVLFATAAPAASIFDPEEPEGEWSLLNVILACAGFTISVLTLLGLVACRRGGNGKKPQALRDLFRQDRLGFSWGIVGALAGFVLLLAMVATQNMAYEMVLADGHTLLFSTGVALQLTCVALLRLGTTQANAPGRYWAGTLQDIQEFSWE